MYLIARYDALQNASLVGGKVKIEFHTRALHLVKHRSQKDFYIKFQSDYVWSKKELLVMVQNAFPSARFGCVAEFDEKEKTADYFIVFISPTIKIN